MGEWAIDFGLMFVAAHSADEILQPGQLEVSLRGAIVLAGHCQSAEVLKAAGDLPLRGLILSSMDVSVVPVALKMRYPIILIEGFGHLPMSSAAYKLLSTNEQREVAINADPWNPLTGARPEIASYPFTRQGIIVGHYMRGDRRYQVVDTPGLLDRPLSEKNDIERYFPRLHKSVRSNTESSTVPDRSFPDDRYWHCPDNTPRRA